MYSPGKKSILGQNKPIGGVAVNWSHPISRNLERFWIYNEGSGLKVQDLAKGFHGTIQIQQAIGWVNTNKGIGLRCTVYGSSNLSSISTASWTTGTTFSIECLVRPSSVTGGCIWEYNGTSGLYHRTTGPTFAFSAGATRLLNNTIIVAGTWYHVLFSCKGGAGQWYVNGRPDGSGTGIATQTLDTQWADTANSDFAGDAVFLRCWSRDLNLAEAQELYANPYCFLAPISTLRYFVAEGGAKEYSWTGVGGAVAGGTVDLVRLASCLPTAGGVAGGTVPGVRTQVYISTSGAIAGGTATYAKVKKETPVGGGVAGGTATVTVSRQYSYTGSGGAVAGGLGTQSRTRAHAPTAGGVVGGTADFIRVDVSTGTGGAVAGGEVTVSETHSFIGIGGGVAGGEADYEATSPGSYSWTGKGGAISGGAADELRLVTLSPTGGAVAGGAVDSSRTRTESAAGGCVAGGSADYVWTPAGTKLYSYEAVGGAIGGGTTSWSCTGAFIAEGGAVAGGEATVTTSGTPLNEDAYQYIKLMFDPVNKAFRTLFVGTDSGLVNMNIDVGQIWKAVFDQDPVTGLGRMRRVT